MAGEFPLTPLDKLSPPFGFKSEELQAWRSNVLRFLLDSTRNHFPNITGLDKVLKEEHACPFCIPMWLQFRLTQVMHNHITLFDTDTQNECALEFRQDLPFCLIEAVLCKMDVQMTSDEAFDDTWRDRSPEEIDAYFYRNVDKTVTFVFSMYRGTHLLNNTPYADSVVNPPFVPENFNINRSIGDYKATRSIETSIHIREALDSLCFFYYPVLRLPPSDKRGFLFSMLPALENTLVHSMFYSGNKSRFNKSNVDFSLEEGLMLI